jgi:hypothetical protein
MYRCRPDTNMKYLLALTLVAIAGCAGPNLQGYHIVRTSDPTAADTSCRQLADPRDHVRSFCASAAQWEQYDKWAASAGVTCDEQTCLTAGQRRQLEYRQAAAAVPGRGPVSPGPSTAGLRFTGEITQPYATSYGPFPAGGAVGQAFH